MAITTQELGRRAKEKGIAGLDNLSDFQAGTEVVKHFPQYRSQVDTSIKTEAVEDVKSTARGISAQFKDLKNFVSRALGAQKRGEQTAPETGVQLAGKGLGFGAGVIGEAALGAASLVVPERTEEKIRTGASNIGEKTGLANLSRKYEEFKAQDTRKSRLLEAGLGFAEVGLEALGGPLLRRIVPSGKNIKGIELTGGQRAGQAKLVDALNGATKTTKDVAGDILDFGAKQVTGLDTSTLRTIVNNADTVDNAIANNLDRFTTGKRFLDDIEARASELETTGAEYNTIRDLDRVVEIPQSAIDDLLVKKFKLAIEDGAVISKLSSAVREATDLSAINSIYSRWVTGVSDGTGVLRITPDEFLNMRQDLAQLAKFDRINGKTKASEGVAKAIRAKINEVGRPQIEGLKEIDTKFGPQVKLLKSIRKELIDEDGNIKDRGFSRIANALNKPNFLRRLEEISPGVTDRLKVLAAVEDVEVAQGLKIGTYFRGGLAGAGAVTGNILPTALFLALTSPRMVVRFLVWYGKNINPRLRRTMDRIAGKIKSGKELNAPEKRVVGEAMSADKTILQRFMETKEFMEEGKDQLTAGASVEGVEDVLKDNNQDETISSDNNE